ncbi:MAG: hypothetical protein SWO11_17020, partial [Thermodesulfobacteriota bacterium]|nr:hypothetical protein [Thermodesulfobacteriota bacterium]
MKIVISTASYDVDNFGKPWIVKVDFSKSAHGKFRYGEWIGDYPGSPGLLSIIACPGDIIATGQKDYRKPNNPTNYSVVMEDGLEHIGGKGSAYKYFLQNNDTALNMVNAIFNMTPHPVNIKDGKMKMKTKVRNMTGRTGRKVANQFIISDCFIEYKTRTGEIMRSQKGNMFQSYQSNIAFKSVNGHTFLDAEKWD